jgi:hypothetical protein
MIIPVKERKDKLFGELTPILKPLGYKLFNTSGDPRYVKETHDIAAYCFFNFNTGGSITFSRFDVSIKIIETIMYEIKLPHNDLSFIDHKKYFLSTVKDTQTPLHEGFLGGMRYDVKSYEDLDRLTEWIKHYFLNEGQAFVDKYSYLPNILTEMDRLEAEGKYWHGGRERVGILCGSVDSFFRGLLISKLTNDKNFSHKVELVENILYDEKNDVLDWVPLYEKIKTRLETLEPIYNV